MPFRNMNYKHINDSWLEWLKEVCDKNEIQLINPIQDFIKFEKKGIKTFGDHFTKYGHAAFARSFMNYFNDLNE